MMDDRDKDAGGYESSGSGGDSPGGGSSGGGSAGGGGSSGLTGGVKLPRHDFVSKLVKDPSNLSSEDGMVLLNGWAGDSDEEGHTRLYCEPTLDCYADVKDDDIVHYEEDPQVGYRVWARRNAQVRYGRRGQGKREASSFFSGQLLQDYRGGAEGGAQAAGGQGTGQGDVHNTIIGPTGWHYCSILTCPPTYINQCGVLPPSFGCPPQQGAAGGAQAAANVGPTGWLGCTQPGHCVGVTGWQGCTHALGCPSSSTCPPQGGGHALGAAAPAGGGAGGPVGVTGWLGCTQAIGCPSSSTCPPQGTVATVGCVGPTGWLGCTQGLGCPGTSTCPPHGPIGVTGWLGCTHMLGCPSSSTCPPQGGAEAVGGGGQSTAATVCTQIGCGHTHLLGCGPRTSDCPPTWMPGCPNTSTCTPQGGGGEALGAAPGGGQSTTATVCTQIGCHTQMLGCPRTSTCPPHITIIGPTAWLHCTQMLGCPSTSTCPPGGGSGQHTIATVCTQLHCPGPATYGPGCTLGFTCTYVGCQQ